MAARRDQRWQLTTRHARSTYATGLKPGDRVTPRRRIPRYHGNSAKPYAAYSPGEIFTVLPGSVEAPHAIWLLNPEGDRCTWDDTNDFFDDFEIIGDASSDAEKVSG